MEKFAKYFSFAVLLFALSGCSSLDLPNYISDHNPYRESFAADFEDVLTAAAKAIDELGWNASKSADPAIFEHNHRLHVPDGKQVILFSDVRQTAFFLGTRYYRINILVWTGQDKKTEIEFRYMRVTNLPFKSFYKYRNDNLAKRVFNQIQKNLNSPES